MTEPIRIANCSGFLGDRQSGALEMVEGGPIDVLTGDWLAELTMLILTRIRLKKPRGGFAAPFVRQMEQVMGSCLDQGIKVVSNAGGLDPDGCAEAVQEVAEKLGLSPTIAYVNGDDLMPRAAELVSTQELRPFSEGGLIPDADKLISANAYLGCWGIVEALNSGADIVVTGRVTDAAVVCGPAAWHHGWARTDLDQLAGAVAAGHIIECSGQATGGNYSFFTEIADMARVGFPWAEVASDGSSVIGKHDGTGGEVSVGTITSQLLYEIGGPAYLGPDVTSRFDTISLESIAKDRVRVSGVQGEAPPATLKVATNEIGGYRNEVTVALTGLDIDAKAAVASEAFWDACPYSPADYDVVVSTVERTEKPDPDSNQEASAVWRLVVKDSDEKKVGRAFTNAAVQTALSSIPGMYSPSGVPGAARPYGVYRPAVIAADLVPQKVTLLGTDSDAPQTQLVESVFPGGVGESTVRKGESKESVLVPGEATTMAPLGTIIGARSGDKGGDANLGLFARTGAQWQWLDAYLDIDTLRGLLPEISEMDIERHPLPNLLSVNFVVHGLLEEGVAASSRRDGQAKSLGEWVRARLAPIPTRMLTE